MADHKEEKRKPEPWDVWSHKRLGGMLWVIGRIKVIVNDQGDETLYVEMTPLKGKYQGMYSNCSVETLHRDYDFKLSLLDNEKLYYSTLGKV